MSRRPTKEWSESPAGRNVGPYRLVVPAERTRPVRFNDLTDPAPIPVDIDFASQTESDVLIVVQHTRLDSRQVENALQSTIAFTGNESPQPTLHHKARAFPRLESRDYCYSELSKSMEG